MTSAYLSLQCLLVIMAITLSFAGNPANSSIDENHRTKHTLPVPIISVSFNSDPKNYTLRLMRSIDYPVKVLAIQIGNFDVDIVNKINASLHAHMFDNKLIGEVRVSCLDYNPGSAKGFNFGLKQLNISSGGAAASWVLVVNNDIAFYPGVLRHLSRSVERAIRHDERFGIGFTSLCCGSEWSTVAFTRRLVAVVGLFDENFYPAYYEDDDYAIRVHHSGAFAAARFNNTPLLHGDLDGSKDYLSGLFTQLYLRPDKSAATDAWRRSHELGVRRSVSYIESKWGIKTGDFKDKNKLDCKSVEGINGRCSTGFSRPFNNPQHSLAHWELSADTLDRISNGGNTAN